MALALNNPYAWLYLLGTITLLTVALRRLKLRLKPLSDEVYSRSVAFEYVHSGIAWVKSDGKVGSVNASLAAALSIDVKEAIGLDWYDLFAKEEKARIQEAYSQMLLIGRARLDVRERRSLADTPGLELLIVAVHDHKMRYVGHHCLIADRTRERTLETQVHELRASLESLSRQLAAAQQVAAVKQGSAAQKPGSGNVSQTPLTSVPVTIMQP
jgi:hypothetical protein